VTVLVVFVMCAVLLAAFAVAGAQEICDESSCEWCGDECEERRAW
jgi:hypothetical protein